MLLERHLRLIALTGLISLTGCGDASQPKSKDSSIYVTETCFTGEASNADVPSGFTTLGSNDGYLEERPARQAEIVAFNIDVTEVTNAQFEAFISETGYITSAEKLQPGFDLAGAAVFTPPDESNSSWWRFVEGANWRHPDGPESSIKGRGRDPVVQVSYEDAKAYAAWAGRTLPTEAQWEHAARAGSQTRYIWGESRTVDGVEQANTWQGAFPIQNTEDDGYLSRAPVGCYSPNAFGLYDMIGNVWEWTDTVYRQSEGEPIYVIKGGSFLCAENYCRRYRPAARQPQEAGFPTNHIGFRTAKVK